VKKLKKDVVASLTYPLKMVKIVSSRVKVLSRKTSFIKKATTNIEQKKATSTIPNSSDNSFIALDVLYIDCFKNFSIN